jgi:hypothetical protein
LLRAPRFFTYSQGMLRRIVILLLASLAPAQAIEKNGDYDTTQPTSATFPNWNIGWGATSVTGWDYLGSVNNASGVYLGNGWVMTAGHIGAGDFVIPYGPGAGSYKFIGTPQPVANPAGTADLTLFQIQSPPAALPPLILPASAPIAFSSTKTGTSVAMLGFGGGQGLCWGLDTVTEINQSITPANYSYVSTDFFADHGTVTRGSKSITNNSQVVVGDSGGGDFAYNSSTGKWELIGINEVSGSFTGTNGNPYYGDGTFSGMVQLSTYQSQITGIVDAAYDTPTMPVAYLGALAAALFLFAVRSFPARKATI